MLPTTDSSDVTARAETLNSRFIDADQSPGLLLWRVSMLWQAQVRAALAPYDLTHTQFVLLASLTWLARPADQPVTQRALARYAALDVMMTSQVIRTLETKGFVLRRAHPTDARARALTVTEAGRRTVNAAVVAVEQCDAEFFARAGDQEPGLLIGLGRLATAPPTGSAQDYQDYLRPAAAPCRNSTTSPSAMR